MAILIPIKYHHRSYPNNIAPKVKEDAGHMDIASVDLESQFCLHTEYSYGKRKLSSELLSHFPSLIPSHKNNVPQLWYNTEWASQFADFIFKLTEGVTPLVIEIHPPFSDYTDSISILTVDSMCQILTRPNYWLMPVKRVERLHRW